MRVCARCCLCSCVAASTRVTQLVEDGKGGPMDMDQVFLIVVVVAAAAVEDVVPLSYVSRV